MAAPLHRGLDVEVTRLDGSSISIAALSREAPLLVVFTRHFGCPGCSRTITELVARKSEISALGLRAVVGLVGNFDVAQAVLLDAMRAHGDLAYRMRRRAQGAKR